MPSASRCVVLADDPKRSFALMLIRQGHSVVAVRETGGERLYLAISCKSSADAKRRTVEIESGIVLLGIKLQLGAWMARRTARGLLLFWPSVELHALH